MKSWRLCEREEDVVNTGGIRWRKRKWEEEEERQGEEERGGFPDGAGEAAGPTAGRRNEVCEDADVLPGSSLSFHSPPPPIRLPIDMKRSLG